MKAIVPWSFNHGTCCNCSMLLLLRAIMKGMRDGCWMGIVWMEDLNLLKKNAARKQHQSHDLIIIFLFAQHPSHPFLRLRPGRNIRKALEEILLNIIQTVVRRRLARCLARKLCVKVGHVRLGCHLGQEWWLDPLVVHIVKVHISEIRMCFDLLRVRRSCAQTKTRHLHQQLFYFASEYIAGSG